MTTIEREAIRVVAFAAAHEGIDFCDALIRSEVLLELLGKGQLTALELIRVAEEDFEWMTDKLRSSRSG